ncbi:phage tail protein [Methyloversatilis sp.]|uniref:phage tail protein n=1 Tax=Methyloversatilis sp. TaxID=2569862 RepID=UPI003D293B65
MPVNVPVQVAPGFVDYFAASVPPAGWLECDGAAVSRTTYAALFLAIGTTFGAGDGSTTFNIPDCRGEFIRGWDNGRGVDSARALGSVQGHQMQSHTHTTPQGVAATGGFQFAGGGNGVSSVSGATGGTSNGSENRPRNVAMLTCIKF